MAKQHVIGHFSPRFICLVALLFAFGSPDQASQPSACDERWSFLDVHIGMMKQDILNRYSGAEKRTDDRGHSYYVVELKHPLDKIDVRRAVLGFWFDESEFLEVLTVSLRRGASFEDVAAYFEQIFGKPNILTSATYSTWWGGLRSRSGAGWEGQCGINVRIERGDLTGRGSCSRRAMCRIVQPSMPISEVPA